MRQDEILIATLIRSLPGTWNTVRVYVTANVVTAQAAVQSDDRSRSASRFG